MRNPAWAEPLGILLLRFGCAWFIFVWAVAKFTAPGQYRWLVRRFDAIEIDLTTVYIVGGLQILVCLMVFLGLFRTVSYAALAAIHGFTVTRVWERLIDPFAVSAKGFPVNRNSAITLSIFLAMLALWLLRGRDRWSIDGWIAARRKHAAAPGDAAAGGNVPG